MGTSTDAAHADHAHPTTGLVRTATVTTKGDLLVATASGAVTRRGVGSNGQVLTADSTQSDGVKWSTPTTGGVPDLFYWTVSGLWYPYSTLFAGSLTTASTTANNLVVVPFIVPTDIGIDAVGFYMTTPVGSVLSARVGLYSVTSTGTPGTLLYDSGSLTVPNSTNVWVSGSYGGVGGGLLAAGLYYSAFWCSGAPTVTGAPGSNLRRLSGSAAGTSVPSTSRTDNSSSYSSGLPTTFPSGAAGASGTAPVIFVRAA